MRLSLLFSCLVMFSCAQRVSNADAAAFKKLVDSGKYELIDLRTDAEITSKGMIPGAMQIDYFAKDASQRIETLDRSKAYLVYCAGGGRSSECAGLMDSLGFKQVVNLEKGFDDWKRKGYAVQKR